MSPLLNQRPGVLYLMSALVWAACTCFPRGDSTLSLSIWHRQYFVLKAWLSYRMACEKRGSRRRFSRFVDKKVHLELQCFYWYWSMLKTGLWQHAVTHIFEVILHDPLHRKRPLPAEHRRIPHGGAGQHDGWGARRLPEPLNVCISLH